MRTTSYRTLRGVLGLALCVVAAACSDDGTAVVDPDVIPNGLMLPVGSSDALRSWVKDLGVKTDLYHDLTKATDAGYRPSTAGCESTATGAMGIHYGSATLMGIIRGVTPTNGTDAVIDPLVPEVLMYEPHADGSRELVGVEFVVYRSAWDAEHTQPPSLHGVPFNQKFGAEAHGHADHYELHVWLWRPNPLGIFAPWNPKVVCP